MIDKPRFRWKPSSKPTSKDWLIATMIVGLLLLIFWIGYGIGKDLS